MDTEWKKRILACLLSLLLLPGIILIIINEQPSIRAFIIIAISYCVGLPLGQQLFLRASVSPSAVQRQLSPGQAQIVGLSTFAVIFSLQLLGGKRLAGDVIAGFLSIICGTITYAIGYYWRTRHQIRHIRKDTNMTAYNPHLVEVRRIGQGFLRKNYHITLLSPDRVHIQDWQESYSKREIEELFTQLRRQYGQISIFFLDPQEDISIIFLRLTGYLCGIAAWYRANTARMTQQQQADIQASFQSIMAVVSRKVTGDDEQALSEHYTAEATIIKNGLVRNQYQIKIIAGYTDVIDEIQGKYTYLGLSRMLYRRYPNLQNYRITWQVSSIDIALDWIKAPIHSFQAVYTEYQNRLTPEQNDLLRAIVQRISRLLNG